MAPELTLRPPKKKSKWTLMVYNPQHAIRFGLRVASRDADDVSVTSCVPHFCEVFGREVSATQDNNARQKTDKIKHFQTFRSDLYTKHLKTEHAQKWEDDVIKHNFFSVAIPFANKVTAHFDHSPELSFVFNVSIVEIIIGELLFNPSDLEGVTYARALRMFNQSSIGGEYSVKIKTPKRFAMVVGVVETGASFHHACRIVQLVRDETRLAYYGGCTYTMAPSYVRVVCANALQKLSDAFGSITGFSLALDSLTVNGMPNLDMRCRFTVHGELYKFHLLALPLYGQHTERLLTDALIKLLDALHAPWRDISAGVATDGTRSMTGHVRGVTTPLEEEVPERTLIRVWCGLHQLDLVMQRVFESALDESFYNVMTATIGHLWRQQTLVARMQATCPRVADSRWLSQNSTQTQRSTK